MTQTKTLPTQTSRERLLKLVARYHVANKSDIPLSAADQQELEALVMSELRMPLERAKNLLVHLVQYEEEEVDEVADAELGLDDEIDQDDNY